MCLTSKSLRQVVTTWKFCLYNLRILVAIIKLIHQLLQYPECAPVSTVSCWVVSCVCQTRDNSGSLELHDHLLKWKQLGKKGGLCPENVFSYLPAVGKCLRSRKLPDTEQRNQGVGRGIYTQTETRHTGNSGRKKEGFDLVKVRGSKPTQGEKAPGFKIQIMHWTRRIVPKAGNPSPKNALEC